ncbi:unnamed protein product, partial [Agarophyton chilense]
MALHRAASAVRASLAAARLVTIVVPAACVLLFVLPPPLRPELSLVCLQPRRVVSQLELHRLFTFAFFHVGPLHLLLNVAAWWLLAAPFEAAVHSLSVLFVLVLLLPLAALLHTALAFFVDALAATHLRDECAVGLSGALFSLLVLNLHAAAAASVSVFGMFDLPSAWYPVLLAGFLQLISPALSLLGHLSGILVAHALTRGYLSFLTPSDHSLQRVEHALQLARLARWKPDPALATLFYGTAALLPSRVPPDRPSPSLFQRCTSAVSRLFSSQPQSQPQSPLAASAESRAPR